jgi:hypothetical protein
MAVATASFFETSIMPRANHESFSAVDDQSEQIKLIAFAVHYVNRRS